MISRYSSWLKLAYILIVTFILIFTFSKHVYDDPFITYRYAENLRSGYGFVYNQGEYTLSTTTPLFALLLASLGNLWVDIQLLANLFGALSIAFGGLLIWELGQTWKAPWVGLTGLLLYPTFPLLLSTMGSETPLFLTLILGSFLLYSRQRFGWVVLLITFAILTRSEGVLAAVVLGCHYIWGNRNYVRQRTFWNELPWLWIGIAVGLLLVWYGFAWGYFGGPLPVTLAAKQAQGRMAISQHFAPGVLRIAGWYSGGWHYWVELGLIAIGTIYSIIKKQQWLLILSWIVLYFLAYSLLGVTSYFWYYAPLVPGWVIAVGLGISFLRRLPIPTQIGLSPILAKIHVGAVGMLLIGLFVAQVINVQKMSLLIDPRYAIYKAAGEWLAENTAEDASVGALEIGIIGYFSQRSMVDFAGLIQPQVADQLQYATTYEDAAIWAVEEYTPDYVLLFSNIFPRLVDEHLASSCELTHQLPGVEYDHPMDIVIFDCR